MFLVTDLVSHRSGAGQPVSRAVIDEPVSVSGGTCVVLTAKIYAIFFVFSQPDSKKKKIPGRSINIAKFQKHCFWPVSRA